MPPPVEDTAVRQPPRPIAPTRVKGIHPNARERQAMARVLAAGALVDACRGIDVTHMPEPALLRILRGPQKPRRPVRKGGPRR